MHEELKNILLIFLSLAFLLELLISLLKLI